MMSVIAGSEFYEVQATGSMRPAFDEGWWLLVKPINFEDIKVGDVIIYTSKLPGMPELIVHRVWSRSSNGQILILKGDHNPDVDGEWVTPGMVVGVVVGQIKKPCN